MELKQRHAELQARFDKLNIAVKMFKLGVEEASRLLWVDVERAERLLHEALKKAEQDGL